MKCKIALILIIVLISFVVSNKLRKSKKVERTKFVELQRALINKVLPWAFQDKDQIRILISNMDEAKVNNYYNTLLALSTTDTNQLCKKMFDVGVCLLNSKDHTTQADVKDCKSDFINKNLDEEAKDKGKQNYSQIHGAISSRRHIINANTFALLNTIDEKEITPSKDNNEKKEAPQSPPVEDKCLNEII